MQARFRAAARGGLVAIRRCSRRRGSSGGRGLDFDRIRLDSAPTSKVRTIAPQWVYQGQTRSTRSTHCPWRSELVPKSPRLDLPRGTEDGRGPTDGQESGFAFETAATGARRRRSEMIENYRVMGFQPNQCCRGHGWRNRTLLARRPMAGELVIIERGCKAKSQQVRHGRESSRRIPGERFAVAAPSVANVPIANRGGERVSRDIAGRRDSRTAKMDVVAATGQRSRAIERRSQ